MCFKYLFFKNKSSYKIIKYDKDSPSIFYSPKREKINKNDYYSPHCTKRPYYALRQCMNCNTVFYSYEKKDFCSKECSISYINRDILDDDYY